MRRKIALILNVFAILCTFRSAVPGLTSSTAVACDEPGCIGG